MTHTVVVDQMRPKLLDLEQVTKVLQTTEPLASTALTHEAKVKFKLGADWASTLDAIPGTFPVDAYMSIDGIERQLTKDAALQAGANFGYTAALMKKMPSTLAEHNLNYWYSGGFADSEYNVLSVQGAIAAFTRPTLTPFSNLSLLERAISGIKKKYGPSTEILADYKISNSLQQTDVRLIVPEQFRTITDGNELDVPHGQSDIWSAGVHLTNSLIGKKQTSLEAYLFRWWCTNGATMAFDQVGAWSRRFDSEEQDVYEWAAGAVDEILGGLESRFDQVQALTSLNVGSNTADVVREIFREYEVPVSQRQQISDTLLSAAGNHDLSMYNIMQAVTQVANDPELDPRRGDRLMRIGGDIPTAVFDTLKAKVWREGHIADPDAPNPYEIVPITA